MELGGTIMIGQTQWCSQCQKYCTDYEWVLDKSGYYYVWCKDCLNKKGENYYD